ncbi:hypothetical protein MPH_13948, partial [Macrophomina phaseolina MS6]
AFFSIFFLTSYYVSATPLPQGCFNMCCPRRGAPSNPCVGQSIADYISHADFDPHGVLGATARPIRIDVADNHTPEPTALGYFSFELIPNHQMLSLRFILSAN